MVNHVRGRLTSDVSNFSDIITDIDRGEIKIPKFQRPFVWSPEQATNLIDSVARGYPVGSLLIWKTNDRLKSERRLGDFALPETDEMSPTRYILDGQQRITVLYSALGADPDDDGFSPYYNLKTGKIEALPTHREIWHFPLRFTYRTSKLLNFRTAIQALEDGDELQVKLDDFIESVTGYRVPIVELRDLTVEEVCPIFERINSSGTKLSTFDLIAAATWSDNFDLSDAAEDIQAALQPKGFEGISQDTVLKCLAAGLLHSIKKEDIMNLRSADAAIIQNGVEVTKEAMKRAVDQLMAEYGIQAMNFLPYEAHLVCLSYVFSSIQSLNADQQSRMRQWFWRSALSQHYRGASEAFVSSSLNAVLEFILQDRGDVEQFGMPLSHTQIMSSKFSFRAATSKAFVISLAKRNPRNITNGTALDLATALSSYNNKQYHHIYPQAHLERAGISSHIHSFANICMLSAGENNRVSDTDPTIYLPQAIRDLGNNSEAVMLANLMPLPADFNYSTGSFQDFIQARARIIAAHFATLCDGIP